MALSIPITAAEELLGLGRLNRLYRLSSVERERAEDAFPDLALRVLGIGYDIDHESLSRVPESGGVVVVANHPHGALDGLVLASILGRRRKDFRLLGNHLLARIPEVRPFCIFVDPFGDRRAARRNAAGIREALTWLRRGGALVVFPAGEVSHAGGWRAAITDPEWQPAVARLVERADVPVLPMHITGANSRFFQVAGLVHPRLRTTLLARELLGHRGRRVQVRAGTVIPWSRLEEFRSADARMTYLRFRAYGLDSAQAPHAERRHGGTRERTAAPLVVADTSAVLAREVEGLDPARVLHRHGQCRVICARAHEIPRLLREIGRLREATFRAAGEGTGHACDLDHYDAAYWHLLVWDAARQLVAGAYRIGPTDDLGAVRNPHRLYTRSLFHFGRSFLSRLGPALELGRSFVQEEYQRDFGTLMLLWKGIGRFVAQAPRYRTLFGPVSVSANYQQASRELVVSTLSTPRYQSPLAGLVKPKRPLIGPLACAASHGKGLTLGSDQVHELLAEIEDDRKGLPVLLRQYLKLNAKLLAFSVDPAFGHVVDGLMVVDLTEVEPAVLQRYMGRDGMAAFLAHHRARQPASPDVRPAVASA